MEGELFTTVSLSPAHEDILNKNFGGAMQYVTATRKAIQKQK